MFRRKEIIPLLIAIFVMTLALAFDDGAVSFELNFWLTNFVLVFIMVAFSFLVHQFMHKWVAKVKGFQTEFQLWGLKNFKFSPMTLSKGVENYFPRKYNILGKKITVNAFPIGVVLAVFLTLISNGVLFFLAVGQYVLLVKSGSRVGRRFVEVTDFDEAQIALAGPLSHVGLILLAAFFNAGGVFDTFIFINSALAIFYLLPIHNLDGTKVFFGSPALYVAALVLTIVVIVLVYFLSIIPLLILSGVALIVGLALGWYYWNFND